MPPRKRGKSVATRARRIAAKRKQETEDERAIRLENMRNYVKKIRAKETESEREKRLKSMRCYVRRVRQQKYAKERKKKLALLIEQSKNDYKDIVPKEPETINFIEIEIDLTGQIKSEF